MAVFATDILFTRGFFVPYWIGWQHLLCLYKPDDEAVLSIIWLTNGDRTQTS